MQRTLLSLVCSLSLLLGCSEARTEQQAGSLEETASQIATEAGLSTEEAVEAVESTLELADQILEGMASVYEAAS